MAGGVTSKFGKYYNDKGQYVGKVVGDKFTASKDELLDRMAKKSPAGLVLNQKHFLSLRKKSHKNLRHLSVIRWEELFLVDQHLLPSIVVM